MRCTETPTLSARGAAARALGLAVPLAAHIRPLHFRPAELTAAAPPRPSPFSLAQCVRVVPEIREALVSYRNGHGAGGPSGGNVEASLVYSLYDLLDRVDSKPTPAKALG